MTTKPWQSYEEVAQYLLNQIAEYFELGHVEGNKLFPVSQEQNGKSMRKE